MAGKVLVIGATGNIGAPLVAELVRRGQMVKAASRTGRTIAGAESVVFDLADASSFAAAFEEVDRAYVMVPTGHLGVEGLLKPLIRFAADRKVKVVLQSVFGVDADDSNPYRQAELFLEETLAPHVILRPNWFADNFHTFWLEGIRGHSVIGVPAGDGKSSFIDVRDIAASAAAALTSDAFVGKAFNLTGPEALDYAEAAKLITSAAGRTITYISTSDEAFIEALVEAGVPRDYAAFLASIFYPVREGWTAAVTEDVKTLTGNEPRSLATYVADHARFFA